MEGKRRGQVGRAGRRVQDVRGFVIQSVRLVTRHGKPVVEARLGPDPRVKRRCSCCGKQGRVHDKLPERRWHFVPLWGIAVQLVYVPRRAVCPTGGPTVEAMPWNKGKHPYAEAFMIFLARWARRLSWKETAAVFGVSWDAVHRSVEWVVEWGHRPIPSHPSPRLPRPASSSASLVRPIRWGRPGFDGGLRFPRLRPAAERLPAAGPPCRSSLNR